MTRSLRRAMSAALVFVLALNLTYLLLPTLASAAQEAEISPLIVTPATATAGATLYIGGAGFAPGELLVALAVTPNRQTLNLGLVDGQTLAVGDGAAPVADASGAVALALATAANYQTGGWSIVLRGQESGRESWGQFSLVASATTPVAAQTTATATAPPPTAAPAPAVTPAPSVAPAPTAAPTVVPAQVATPSTTPSAAPVTATAVPPTAPAASAAPAASEVPSAPPSASPTAEPSAAPAASAAPSASAAPAAPAATSAAPSPTPAPSAPASPSVTPSPSPSPVSTTIGPGAQVVVDSPAGAANVRQQPSTSAAIVQVVANGTVLTVTGAGQGGDGYIWWPVQGNGVQGWLVEGLIQLAPNAAASPGVPASPGASPAPGATPEETNPGVPPPPIDAPALAPSQLLPIFERAAQLHGIPVEILLAIGRVESGFSPRAVGPLIPRFAGTEDQHALGMMQFLPSTYRGVMARVDAATGKNLGMNGIWDAESAIHAAAIYLKDGGAPGNMRRALFSYNNADWYVDLILSWASHYASGTIPDPTLYDPNSNGAPPSRAVPQNPLIPSNTRHIDMLSPITLYAPWTAGQTWSAGGAGSFYGDGYHVDTGGHYYAVDFNKGVWPRLEEDDGEPILAAADGIVNNIYQDAAGAWVVELYHLAPDGSQLRTLYVHLKMDPRINPGIQPNQVVYHGTPIGLNGSTGNSTGPHLHFGLWLLRDGQWVSIRAEPMEGQYLFNGVAITSTNVPPSGTPTAPRTLQAGFAPNSPSNADRVMIAAQAQGGAGPLDTIEVFVNTAGDGSDRGQWQSVGQIAGDSGQVEWQAAPIADGTYRVLFAMVDPEGNRSYHGLANDTAVRYTIRRGEPRGSVVVNPRADLALLAPLDGAAINQIGSQHPIVSGPLRFIPAADRPGALAGIGRGAAIIGQTTWVGSGASGKVREGAGLFIEEATTNLVTNPSFEINTEGWAIRNLPGAALVATVAPGGPFGKQAVRLDNREGTAAATFVTVAGDGNTATWSVYGRAAVEPGATPPDAPTLGLQMSGGTAKSFPLTADWQRLVLTGATGGTGNERRIVVPAGAVIEVDAAQLEPKPYATTYADGSLGSGYGWDRVPDGSLSGRLPASLQVRLDGAVGTGNGAIGFWATSRGETAPGAQLLTLGDRLTLSIADETLNLRWGEQVIGAMPWVRGETHHYALTWERGTLAFFQDGQLVVETFLSDFALPGEPIAFVGADPTGARAANVVIQDLAVWSSLPSRPVLAAVAGAGEFLHPGVPQAQTLDVTVALASQGLTPNGLRMQFSFDGQTWTAPEPFTPTKTVLLPDTGGNVQVYVRFTDEQGRTIVIIDRIQIVARPEQLEDETP